MSTLVTVLIILAAVDLIACGALLAVVWAAHRRQRRRAREAGEPVPPPATGQFLFLALLGTIGIVALYAAAAVVLDW